MRNIFLFIIVFLSIGLCRSQVAINTQNPLGIFHIDGKGDNLVTPTSAQIANDFVVTSDGYVGIASIPSIRLDIVADAIKSGFKLTDGSEGSGRTLMSDSQGFGLWRDMKQTALVWNTNHQFTIPVTGVYVITLYFDDNNTTNAYTNKWVNPTLDGGTSYNGVALYSLTRNNCLMSNSNNVSSYGVTCSGTLLLFAGEILMPRALAWNGNRVTQIPILGVEIIAL